MPNSFFEGADLAAGYGAGSRQQSLPRRLSGRTHHRRHGTSACPHRCARSGGSRRNGVAAHLNDWFVSVGGENSLAVGPSTRRALLAYQAGAKVSDDRPLWSDQRRGPCASHRSERMGALANLSLDELAKVVTTACSPTHAISPAISGAPRARSSRGSRRRRQNLGGGHGGVHRRRPGERSVENGSMPRMSARAHCVGAPTGTPSERQVAHVPADVRHHRSGGAHDGVCPRGFGDRRLCEKAIRGWPSKWPATCRATTGHRGRHGGRRVWSLFGRQGAAGGMARQGSGDQWPRHAPLGSEIAGHREEGWLLGRERHEQRGSHPNASTVIPVSMMRWRSCSPLGTGQLDVRAVTTVSGNLPADRCAQNALRMLDLAGRGDIEVARGPLEAAGAALSQGPVLALQRWLGGARFTVIAPPSTRGICPRPDTRGRGALPRGAGGSRARGRSRTCALALIKDPGLPRKLKRLIVIGGSYGFQTSGAERATGDNPASEWNIYVDPEAAKLVFQAGFALTALGLDVVTHPHDRTLARASRGAGRRCQRACSISSGRGGLRRTPRIQILLWPDRLGGRGRRLGTQRRPHRESGG